MNKMVSIAEAKRYQEMGDKVPNPRYGEKDQPTHLFKAKFIVYYRPEGTQQQCPSCNTDDCSCSAIVRSA